MNFNEHFNQDPTICGGVPVIKGTRVPVKTVLSNLKAGRTVSQILGDYPSLKEMDVQAVIAFAAASAEEDMPVQALTRH